LDAANWPPTEEQQQGMPASQPAGTGPVLSSPAFEEPDKTDRPDGLTTDNTPTRRGPGRPPKATTE
jgi:hypothetical protein